jgi:Na+-transporting NADH:ubiquinone oxidoreductase subunit NqrC
MTVLGTIFVVLGVLICATVVVAAVMVLLSIASGGWTE